MKGSDQGKEDVFGGDIILKPDTDPSLLAQNERLFGDDLSDNVFLQCLMVFLSFYY